MHLTGGGTYAWMLLVGSHGFRVLATETAAAVTSAAEEAALVFNWPLQLTSNCGTTQSTLPALK